MNRKQKEEEYSGERTQVETRLSSTRGLVASIIQYKCTKYFCGNLTVALKDLQCFNSILLYFDISEDGFVITDAERSSLRVFHQNRLRTYYINADENIAFQADLIIARNLSPE